MPFATKPRPERFAVLLLLFSGALCADELPSLAPQISSVFPNGARKDSELDIEIRGSNLNGTSRIVFARPGISAQVVSNTQSLVKARFKIAAEAEVSSSEFRLINPQGTVVGVFNVGSLPEVKELEPNDEAASAQLISIPGVINGTAGPDDADLFRFEARRGQTVVFDINAGRSGSALDPVLTLLDEAGDEIAYCDDYYSFKDARLVYTFPRAGKWFVRVTSSYQRSAPNAQYRLLVSDEAYAAFALPAGGARGKSVDIKIDGWNLSGIDRAWLVPDQLGLRVSADSIANRVNRGVDIRLHVPETFPLGSARLHLAAGAHEIPVPLRFEVSDIAEQTISDPKACDQSKPIPIHVPVIVNGEIGERSGNYLRRAHYFEFDAKAGGRYEFRVQSFDLGLRLDPVVALYDIMGKKLAYEDDPAPNSFIHHPASHDPCLVYRFQDGGSYRIMVRDAAWRGGPGFIYRLRVREAQPDFNLDVRAPQATAYIGKKTTMLVQIHRTGGVHTVESFKQPGSEIESFRLHETDGWNAPVMVWAGDLPPGVTGERVSAEPKNTVFKGNDGEELFVDGTLVEAPIEVSPDAKPGVYRIAIHAESSFEGRTAQRTGRVLDTIRGHRGQPTQDGQLYLTLMQPPAGVLRAPPELELVRGEPQKIKIEVFRFTGSGGPLKIMAKDPVTGFGFDEAVVPAGASGIELMIRPSEQAASGELVLVAKTDDSEQRVIAESAPILLNIRMAKK